MLLTAHSWIRWLVLAATVVVGLRCLFGKTWTNADTVLARVWIGVLDTQIAIGLTLYFTIHPRGTFFRALHPLAMVTAITIAHAAWVRARRAEPSARFRRLGRGLVSALAIILVAIPWPR